jgi:hypothetical protein
MQKSKWGSPWFIAILLCVLLGALFGRSFLPGQTIFSNDGPLGTLIQESRHLPEIFTGEWSDLNSIGTRGGGALPSISYGILYLLGPIGFAKFDVPIALLILGLGAWCCFRQLKLAPIACVLGAFAAMLNSGFFSAACWGVATHAITMGMAFFAVAALADPQAPYRWLRVVAAGFAVGMAVMEGADIGALISMYIALFVMYQAWVTQETAVKRIATGVARVGLIAVFAGLLAAQSVSVMLETQIQGIVGTGQDSRSKDQRWDWATQWSFPKVESLSIVMPGLFGYRMDTPEGGNYWGAAGSDPSWDRYFASGKQGPEPRGFPRFSGGGAYGGVLVALVAIWALAQALRKKDSAFSLTDRRYLWFWGGTAFLALLFAWGRFAPFYQFLYALPYFSTIRNPAKFLHFFSFALVIIFAYGIHRMWLLYMDVPSGVFTGISARVKSWHARANQFDKRWVTGCVLLLVAAVLGWLVYASSQNTLIKYLQEVQFDEGTAKAIAAFSARQVGWFILYFSASAGLVLLVLSGVFSGPRARLGAWLLLLLLVLDLGRANLPWIIYWDYQEKYATNPIIDKLRERPYEQRVAMLQFQAPNSGLFNKLYGIEWAQHHFQFYNIQSLDKVQMPRTPEDLLAYEMALQFDGTSNTVHHVSRWWQLTNTRYLLGAAGFIDPLNREMDPVHHRFRAAARFTIAAKPGIVSPTSLEEMTAVLAPEGEYALIEFTGALPRVGLYANWQVVTNDQAALSTISSRDFDPLSTVVVSSPVPGAPTANLTNSGTVKFISYAPKHIVLQSESSAQSVLLLNDRYDPYWKVFVDGKPETLLRCNYIMRGVVVPAGTHQVEFRFVPPIRGLYVSVAALGAAVLLCAFLIFAPKPPVRAQTPR